MKKQDILLTIFAVASVIFDVTSLSTVRAACNSEEQEVTYELDPSISGESLIPVGSTNDYTCTVADVEGASGTFTPPITSIDWQGGGDPATGSGEEFTTSWDTAGEKTLTAVVDGSDTDTQSLVTVDCTNVADYTVSVVEIEKAEVVGESDICYFDSAVIKGTPYPAPDFPVGLPTWSVPSANGDVIPIAGSDETVFTPEWASAQDDDMEIKGKCGTSEASAYVTAVRVEHISAKVGGEEVCVLGFGKTADLTAIDVEPSGRTLEWRIEAKRPKGEGNKESPTVELVAGSGDTATLEAKANSAPGYVDIAVVDSVTGCGWLKTIEVGCDSCASGKCDSFGGHNYSVSSVDVEFSLGAGSGGVSLGSIRIGCESPSAELSSPSSIKPDDRPYHAHSLPPPAGTTNKHSFVTSSMEYIADTNGSARQILVADGLVDIVVSNEFKYDMVFYPKTAVGSKGTNGLYSVTGQPKVMYTIENPDASTNTYNRLRISRIKEGDTNVSEYVYSESGSTNFWTLTTGNGLRTETVAQYSEASYSNILRTVSGPSNAVASVVLTKMGEFEWGWEPVERIVDPDGEALTTTWTYYTNSLETGRYSNVAMVVNPDGSWEKTDYNSNGYRTVEISSYKDAPTNATASQARAAYFDYTLHAGEISGYRASTPRTVTETTLGCTTRITYRAFSTNALGERMEIVERAYDASSSYGSSNNLRTVSTYYAADSTTGKVDRLKSVELPDGRLSTYVYENGLYTTNADPSLCAFAVGTNDYLRTTVTHGTADNPEGVAWKTTRDVAVEGPLGGQLMTETYVFNGAGYDRIRWRVQVLDDSRWPLTVYSSDGTESEATWGCCGKEYEKDSSGIEMDYSYDALDRMDIVTKYADTNIITSYVMDAEGRRLKTTRSAGGLALISSNQFDMVGRTIKSWDQAQIETSYSYPNNGRDTATVMYGGTLTNASYSYLDGRTKYTTKNGEIQSWNDYGVNEDGTTWSISYSGPEGTNSPAWTKTTSDFLGRTVKTERPGFGGAVLTNELVYNAIGQLVKSASTGNPDTLYQYNALGEQVRSGRDVDGDGTLDLGEMDRVTDADRYFEKDGANDYWSVSVSKIYPIDNASTVVTNSIQKARVTGLSASKASESVSIDIRGNQTVATTAIDRQGKEVTQTVDYPDSTTNAISVTVNGLLVSSTTKTGLEYAYGYDALERRIATADPRTGTSATHFNTKGQVDWVEDALSNRTSFAYESTTGRRISTTDAVTNSVHTEYSVEGQVLGTWGGTYPVFYSFDEYDRMNAMYTLRDTGVVVNSYSDFLSNSNAFDRTRWLFDDATGLLTNKLYADGNGTAYSYTGDGKLASRVWARGVTTTYSFTNTGEMVGIDYSDATPDIAFTHTRIGQQKTVTDAQGTHTFGYSPTTLSLTSEVIVANGVTNVITRAQDQFGRSAGLTLDEDYSVLYTYSTIGRFGSVSSLCASASCLATYAYLPNSDMVSGYDVSVDGAAVSLTVTKSYEAHRNLLTSVQNMGATNLVSQFDYTNDPVGRRTQRIDAGSSVATNSFGYNEKSELTSAAMGVGDYLFNYDPIGNRLSASNSTDEWTYLCNELNQYTNITDGSTIEPLYDVDGNMTNYNGWTFAWSGENRMTNAACGTTNISYFYDYMGRMFQRVSGSTTNRYIWDGYNIIAEIAPGKTNYNVWGLDLSLSLQGAGGVGGLLVVVENGTPYLSTADGNGNVIDYIDADGTNVAHYEYGPFGGIAASSGAMKDDFLHRFSTKPWEEETGIIHYELRPYIAAELGRWLTRDSLEEVGGLNLYLYIHNSSVTGVDPKGQCVYWLSKSGVEVQNVDSETDVLVEVRTGSAGGFVKPSGHVSLDKDGCLRIEIHLVIRISAVTDQRLRNQPGEVVYYMPHNGGEHTLALNHRRAAIVAHERGHAAGFLSRRDDLTKTLSLMCGPQTEDSLAGAQLVVDMALEAMWDATLTEGRNAADKATEAAHAPPNRYDRWDNIDGSTEWTTLQ